MKKAKYIEIDKNNIPYSFDITLAGESFTFKIDYNYLHDFFTIDLIKNDEVIIVGEKIMYNKPLFTTVRHKDVPKVEILPFDISNKAKRISYENFNEDVFLYIVGD